MTLEKWVHDRLVLGNDQPFFTGRRPKNMIHDSRRGFSVLGGSGEVGHWSAGDSR